MIYLQSGANTKVDVTCYEFITLTNPSYIVVFVNDSTNAKVGCICTDLSSFPLRYQRFSISVYATTAMPPADPYSGQIAIDAEGFYHYYIYETNTPNLFDFNTLDSTTIDTLNSNYNLVEQGKMLYKFAVPTYQKYINNRTSIKEYNG